MIDLTKMSALAALLSTPRTAVSTDDERDAALARLARRFGEVDA